MIMKKKETIGGKEGFAVIKTGGKQYKVAPGDKLKIEKFKNSAMANLKEGDTVEFSEVLLTASGDDIKFGTPFISGSKVIGTFIEAGRNKKIDVIKYKQKSRYFKKNGHRQPYVMIKIETI
jgi:large subunit ribosomal protein L21